jgi:hypothetical protein
MNALFNLFLFFVNLTYPQCNYDAGVNSYAYSTGFYPYLIGGGDYECNGLQAIHEYSSAEIGLTGFCELIATGTFYGFIAAMDGTGINQIKYYSDYPYGFKCTSRDNLDSEF